MNPLELHDRDHDVRTERTAVAETRGAAHFARLMARRPDQALSAVRAASPQMNDWLVNGPFAGPLAGSELTMGQRELATVAVLAALGDTEPQLAAHTVAALSQGITATELRGIPLHVSVYAGFPRALNALTVIDGVLREAGIPEPLSLHRVRPGDHGTTVAHAGITGPPVVLVHALGLDWRMWEPVIARLAVGRRVFAYDVRGHGSATEAPLPTSMNDLATDLFDVMDALGLDRAHVVGLSYGGGIVQTAATLVPARFASMTLMATTNVAFETFEGRARSVEQDGMAAQVAPSLVRWFTCDGLAVNDWGVRYARDCVLRGDPEHSAAAWRAFQTLDVEGKLTGFSAPTLVLAGERDLSTTPEVMSRIASDIPGARYAEMPGTPHMPTLEQPSLVVDALDGFLPRDPMEDELLPG
ncbi:alpha/beta fold hydrolase [Nocardioides sp.]|uniref:alpha/beta fold hydrolase n=1 Tax=Nocardioides sp. TaxID=35761 RepID=UPI002D1F9D93|nr:alpha/beta fold hydrolase [Nocardioides sp.]